MLARPERRAPSGCFVGGDGRQEGLKAGNSFKPTVYRQTWKNDHGDRREEISARASACITYDSEDEAISIANTPIWP